MLKRRVGRRTRKFMHGLMLERVDDNPKVVLYRVKSPRYDSLAAESAKPQLWIWGWKQRVIIFQRALPVHVKPV